MPANRKLDLVREELQVGKRNIQRARVRVRKVVRKREQAVAQPLRADEVTVKRVKVDRPLERPAVARQEGDVLIVPVMEEVLEKRLVLKEELHIRTRTVQRIHRARVELRSEEIEIERDEGTSE